MASILAHNPITIDLRDTIWFCFMSQCRHCCNNFIHPIDIYLFSFLPLQYKIRIHTVYVCDMYIYCLNTQDIWSADMVTTVHCCHGKLKQK